MADPMVTPDAVRAAVRAACDNALPADGGCQWPSCNCHMTRSMLAALIAAARAEGAKEERERYTMIVETLLEDHTAAIRARATESGT